MGNVKLLLAGLLIAAIVVGAWQLYAHQYHSSFDSAKWRAAGKNLACHQNSDRRRMVEDLRDEHLSEGMAAREIRRLLGMPYYVSPDTRGEEWGVWWGWLTGPSTMDCWTFHIRFLRGQAVEWGEGQT
jgi:hypothetical protein